MYQILKSKSLAFLIVYFIVVNCLFLFKYTERIASINELVCTLSFPFLLGLCFYFFNSPFYKERISNSQLKVLFNFISVFAFVFILLICLIVDKNQLMVDRWSAMEVGIKAWLSGDYPYTATDHLNGRTSNFPGLFVLGLIPYLLNNIAYLQLFNFLALVVVLRLVLPIRKSIFFLTLLLISPAFWWEIYVASDLMTNIFIVMYFLLLVDKFTSNPLNEYPVLMGITTSFLVLTRGIVLIPLALFYTKDFFKLKLRKKIIFLSTGLTTGVLLIYSVLRNVPDVDTLINFNPILLQTTQSPSFVILIALISPFLISYFQDNPKKNLFLYSVLLVLFPIWVGFFIKLYNFGLFSTLVESRFDISYLSLVFPFILYQIVKNMETENSLLT